MIYRMHQCCLKALVMLLFLTGGSAAQSPFIKYTGGSGSDFGSAVTRTPDGGHALAMELDLNYPQNDSTSATLVKLDCLGNVEWVRNYIVGQVSYGTDVKVTPDSCLLMSASALQPFAQDNDMAIIKTAMDGTFSWCKKINVACMTENKLALDGTGNIYAVGNTRYLQGNYDGIALMKFSPDGNSLWTREYTFTYGVTPVSLALLPGGKCLVAGKITLPGNSFSDILLMMTDAAGSQLFSRVIGTPYDDEPLAVTAGDDGHVHVCGRSYFLNRGWDGMHLELDGNLNVLENNFYDGGTSAGEVFRAMTIDATSIAFFGDEGTFNERNPLVVKTSSGNAVQWITHYPIATAFTNYLFGACSNGHGGYLVTGDAHEGARFRDALLMQVDSTGSAGCHSDPFALSVFHDAVTVTDTPLTEVQLTLNITDTMPSVDGEAVSTVSLCSPLDMCIAFTHTQDSVCPNACVTFTDQSIGNTAVLWEIEIPGQVITRTEPSPQICFEQEGIYEVRLTISNSGGSLSMTDTVHVEKECPLFIPNIFTPNNDHVNDVFEIKELPDKYSLEIFNRWGQTVYSSEEPGKFWNGKNENGKLVSTGTYYYILNLTEKNEVHKGWVEVMY